MRIPWSEYEAVIIVDAFYQYKNGLIEKKDAIKTVSEKLRKIAISKGMKIDDVFRNENGIAMQMETLEYIYSEGKVGLRSGSKLFKETMCLYIENPNCFHNKAIEVNCVSENTMDKFSELILSHFTYGIRIESPIELMRFKRFYKEDYGESCPWTDEEIKEKITELCFFHEKKGYVINSQARKAIWNELEKLKTRGHCIVYYNELYVKNEKWFIKLGFFSDDMLKSYIKKYFSNIICKRAYFSWEPLNENKLLRNSILSVWDEVVLYDYYDLKQLLEYIPVEKIKYALANNSCFVWNSAETYTNTSKFVITEFEEQEILEYVEKNIVNKGYVAFDDMPLEKVCNENFNLSKTAIFTLVFDKVLSSKYERINRTITLRGKETNVSKIMENYCLSKREISVDDLFEQWKQKTGTHRRAEALDAAYSTMIRVDANRFVCDEQVDFNEPGIDEVLDTLVTGEAIGLKEISSFALFPDCGFMWNLFLVESFCRRYSKTFKYIVSLKYVNSRK